METLHMIQMCVTESSLVLVSGHTVDPIAISALLKRWILEGVFLSEGRHCVAWLRRPLLSSSTDGTARLDRIL